MRKILFVDDETMVLEGLRRMLRSMRREWAMDFVENAENALNKLKEESFDVVVSDMRMPGMNGSQLLDQVRRQYPQVVRIILSGHSDREMVLRSLGPTHQFLSKPCDAELLKNTITRACALRDIIHNDTLKQIVARIQSLPSLPSFYLELIEEINSPEASIKRVGEIICRDVGMMAKLLQLVNSAFFGLSRQVTSPAQAARLLGLDTIKSLILTSHVFRQFQATHVTGFDLQCLWDHSFTVGAFARTIAMREGDHEQEPDNALMAGMLHDVGQLVLAANMPAVFEQCCRLARTEQIPMWQAESKVMGVSHGQIGAYLLGLWGLPDPIVEALAFHHCLGNCASKEFSTLVAVHVADGLDHEFSKRQESIQASPIDMDHIEQMGFADSIDDWRRLCRDLQQNGASRE